MVFYRSWHKSCDVVLFLKEDGVLSESYQYGMVNEIVPSKDGIIRKVIVWYRNRYTTRSVCDLVLIHPINERTGKSDINSQKGIWGNEHLKFLVLRV